MLEVVIPTNGSNVCMGMGGWHLEALRVLALNIPHFTSALFLTDTAVLVMNFKQQLEEDMLSVQGLWELNVFMT